MKVLHLCSYYYGSKLYENLVKELDNMEIQQEVYVPIKQGVQISLNNFSNCKFIVKETYGNIDRAFFMRKFNKNYNSMINEVDFKNLHIVHSHTLFTNGMMALKLKKEYNIPYIVAVRNTDVNVFFKYFIHLRSKGAEILLNAEKIIFISPSYLETTINKYIPNEFKDDVRRKSLVIPNGLNSYWLDNKIKETKIIDKSVIKLVYAGEITKNKNIHKVISEVSDMHKSGIKIEFDIAGDGEYIDNIRKMIVDLGVNDIVRVHGRVDKEQLIKLFRENYIFVMISTFETFGLSYIEALSQGLPVLFTKGQGIDGYFNMGEVGFAVELDSKIEQKLLNIMENYEEISGRCVKVVDDFRWDKIASQYVDIYKDIK